MISQEIGFGEPWCPWTGNNESDEQQPGGGSSSTTQDTHALALDGRFASTLFDEF